MEIVVVVVVGESCRKVDRGARNTRMCQGIYLCSMYHWVGCFVLSCAQAADKHRGRVLAGCRYIQQHRVSLAERVEKDTRGGIVAGRPFISWS